MSKEAAVQEWVMYSGMGDKDIAEAGVEGIIDMLGQDEVIDPDSEEDYYDAEAVLDPLVAKAQDAAFPPAIEYDEALRRLKSELPRQAWKVSPVLVASAEATRAYVRDGEVAGRIKDLLVDLPATADLPDGEWFAFRDETVSLYEQLYLYEGGSADYTVMGR